MELDPTHLSSCYQHKLRRGIGNVVVEKRKKKKEKEKRSGYNKIVILGHHAGIEVVGTTRFKKPNK